MEKKTPANKATKAPRVEVVTVTPNHLNYIYDEFNGSDLVAVKVPAKVQYLYGAFWDCPNLKSVQLPASVKVIKGFVNCPELEAVYLPKKIEDIHPDSFKNCPKLKVYIKEGSDYVEQDGVIWRKPYVNSDNMVLACVVNPVDLIVPPTVISLSTQRKNYWEDVSFNGCTSLKSIVLNNNIDYIQRKSFQDCINLESINIPNTIISIKPDAFSGCKKLNITWGEKFFEEDGIVYGNDCKSKIMYAVNPVNVVIPNPVTSLNIDNCDSLESIVFPKSIKSSGCYRIEGCQNLKSVVLPEGIEEIRFFINCPALSEINIPNSVSKINCKALRSDKLNITWGDSFFEQDGVIYKKQYDDLIVMCCKNPTNVTLLDGVTEIGSYAFEECDSLESITLPNGVTIINSCAFRNCKSLKSVSLPDGIYKICHEAFVGCSSLEKMNLPKSLVSLYDSDFFGCSNIIIDAVKSHKKAL